MFKINCFIIDVEIIFVCEKKRKGNIKDLEVIFMLIRFGKYILEIRIFGKVVVNKNFEIKIGLWIFYILDF